MYVVASCVHPLLVPCSENNKAISLKTSFGLRCATTITQRLVQGNWEQSRLPNFQKSRRLFGRFRFRFQPLERAQPMRTCPRNVATGLLAKGAYATGANWLRRGVLDHAHVQLAGFHAGRGLAKWPRFKMIFALFDMGDIQSHHQQHSNPYHQGSIFWLSQRRLKPRRLQKGELWV